MPNYENFNKYKLTTILPTTKHDANKLETKLNPQQNFKKQKPFNSIFENCQENSKTEFNLSLV